MRAKRWVAALVVGLCLLGRLPGVSRAQQTAPFCDGDSVCFIGDSITHGGSYHSVVALFYATRFPERVLKVYNCGISGDTAAGALRRFDWDIAVHEPTAAVIMLGMNDIGLYNYNPGHDTQKDADARAYALAEYRRNMTTLAERLHALGCRLTFATPSIYDDTAMLETQSRVGANAALGVCGAFVRELARRLDAGVAGFHGLMNEINARQQAADPTYTLVGPDRVHPRSVGHFVMAYALLDAQGLAGPVAEMGLDRVSQAVTAAENCHIDNVTWTDDGLRFDCREAALPFPVPEDARAALELVPFQQRFNRETLRVTGLAAGDYQLRIDGAPVGTSSASAWAAGIDLADNPATPQYQQARRVREVNAQRHALARRLRYIAEMQHGLLKDVRPLPTDPNEMQRVLNAAVEPHAGTPYYGYLKIAAASYVRDKPQEADLRKQEAALQDEVYRVNRPTTHRFSLRRTDKGGN